MVCGIGEAAVPPPVMVAVVEAMVALPLSISLSSMVMSPPVVLVPNTSTSTITMGLFTVKRSPPELEVELENVVGFALA